MKEFLDERLNRLKDLEIYYYEKKINSVEGSGTELLYNNLYNYYVDARKHCESMLKTIYGKEVVQGSPKRTQIGKPLRIPN